MNKSATSAEPAPAKPAPTYERLGAVRVTPDVIRAIIGLTALATPGVEQLGRAGGAGDTLWRVLGRNDPNEGVRVRVAEDTVSADVYILVREGSNMLEVGKAVQERVAEAIDLMVGMPVREINVYVQDVV